MTATWGWARRGVPASRVQGDDDDVRERAPARVACAIQLSKRAASSRVAKDEQERAGGERGTRGGGGGGAAAGAERGVAGVRGGGAVGASATRRPASPPPGSRREVVREGLAKRRGEPSAGRGRGARAGGARRRPTRRGGGGRRGRSRRTRRGGERDERARGARPTAFRAIAPTTDAIENHSTSGEEKCRRTTRSGPARAARRSSFALGGHDLVSLNDRVVSPTVVCQSPPRAPRRPTRGTAPRGSGRFAARAPPLIPPGPGATGSTRASGAALSRPRASRCAAPARSPRRRPPPPCRRRHPRGRGRGRGRGFAHVLHPAFEGAAAFVGDVYYVTDLRTGEPPPVAPVARVRECRDPTARRPRPAATTRPPLGRHERPSRVASATRSASASRRGSPASSKRAPRGHPAAAATTDPNPNANATTRRTPPRRRDRRKSPRRRLFRRSRRPPWALRRTSSTPSPRFGGRTRAAARSASTTDRASSPSNTAADSSTPRCRRISSSADPRHRRRVFRTTALRLRSSPTSSASSSPPPRSWSPSPPRRRLLRPSDRPLAAVGVSRRPAGEAHAALTRGWGNPTLAAKRGFAGTRDEDREAAIRVSDDALEDVHESAAEAFRNLPKSSDPSKSLRLAPALTSAACVGANPAVVADGLAETVGPLLTGYGCDDEGDGWSLRGAAGDAVGPERGGR